MKKTVQFGSIALFLLLAVVNVQAQKFGYINTAEILAAMPEVKQAETSIENFSNQMQKRGEAEVAKLQAKFGKIQEDMQAGKLSPIQQQDAQKELETDQAALAKFEQDMVTQIQNKRQTVLQPIYDKLNKAIADVAKEKGYNMVFDKAVLLYTEPGDDVSALVKAKLGL